LVWLVTLLPLIAAAQDQPPPTPDPEKRFTILREYLNRDLFVREGVGLKQVRIGQPFKTALRAWGQPRRKVDRGLLKHEQQWFYRADRDTEIMLAGGQVIERMVFRGVPSSLYQTETGVRFGMPPYQVASLYAQAGKQEQTGVLAYPGRGVRFYFENGGVRGFEVFRPAPSLQ